MEGLDGAVRPRRCRRPPEPPPAQRTAPLRPPRPPTQTSAALSHGRCRGRPGSRSVVLDGLRRTRSDQLAVVEDVDRIRDAHHQGDVVLHEEHGDTRVPDGRRSSAPGRPAPRRSSRPPARPAAADAAPRREPGRSRPGAAVRRAGWRPACRPDRSRPTSARASIARIARPAFLGPLTRQSEAARPEARALVAVAADQHVLEHAHVHEDAQVLEGARHAEPGGVRRRSACVRSTPSKVMPAAAQLLAAG